MTTSISYQNKNVELTQDLLKELVTYNPDTGLFYWNNPRWKRKCQNYAGCIMGQGYWILMINYKQYRAHRLAWLYMTGSFPNKHIDHINGNRLDNSWLNLRLATDKENQQNRRKASSRNKSGFLGVATVTKTKEPRYQASIRANGKDIYLGLYKTPEEAHEKYLEAKRNLHPYGTL